MSYQFVDTHCHFDFPPFAGDEAQSLRLAAEAGVEKIIAVSVSAGRFSRVLALAEKFPPVYAALGLHPMGIGEHDEAALDSLAQAVKQRPTKLVALGEIGLDLYMHDPRFDRQKAILDTQLRLARDHDLPVILHSRRTHDTLAQHLRRIVLPRRGVVHGFAGSEQQALAFIRAGYSIGVGGTITYLRASKTRKAIARLPLESLLLETDSPDMPLQGWQGQPNRPERVKNVWQSLCEIRPEPPEQIAAVLRENTRALFLL